MQRWNFFSKLQGGVWVWNELGELIKIRLPSEFPVNRNHLVCQSRVELDIQKLALPNLSFY